MVNLSCETTKAHEDISLCILDPYKIFKLTKLIIISCKPNAQQLLVEFPRLSWIIN